MKFRMASLGMGVVAVCALLSAGPGCVSRKPIDGVSLGAVESADPQLAAHPVAEATAEPAAEPAAEPVAEPTAEPVAPPVAQPVAQPVAEASKVRPGLAVNVTVLVAGKKTIEEVARNVAEDGTLELPLLGTVAVGGMTPTQLGHDLRVRYGEFYIDPQVIVEFARSDQPDGVSPWGSITVLGRVKRPGRVNIPATRDLTVSMAIQQAGGFDTSAKDTAILVTRRTPDGGTTAIRVNLRDVGARGQLEKDIALQSDDVVYIPEFVF